MTKDTDFSSDDLALAEKLIRSSGKWNDESSIQFQLAAFKAGKPLAYITGAVDFGSLSLVSRPPVYIPRVETEQWALLLAEKLVESLEDGQSLRILDICSGSGCVPLLLAHKGKGRISTVGLEVDERALSVARDNAKLNKIDDVSTFQECDIFHDDLEELKSKIGTFDMVVSNPPYVSAADMKELAGEWWESTYALQGKLRQQTQQNSSSGQSAEEQADDSDGLAFYRRIKQIYTTFLKPRSGPPKIPKLVLEVGAAQSAPVQAMFADPKHRLEITKETERRKDISTPRLEKGATVGTERSIWIYDQ